VLLPIPTPSIPLLSCPLQAQAVAAAAVDRLGAFNRRTLDVIAARIYAYLSLAHERTGSLAAIRSALLGLHRTAVLRHDDVGAETLLNLLLRNYLHYNLYDQVGGC
jgi:26S proteasome regulatory subunit N3